jgi:hypothetical protein
MNLDSGGSHLSSRICSTPTISSGVCAALQYKGAGKGLSTINNSYSFVPNVGQTDNYTIYIIVIANPTTPIGSYTTGSFDCDLSVTY